jgi:hypothetical protein
VAFIFIDIIVVLNYNIRQYVEVSPLKGGPKNPYTSPKGRKEKQQ